MSKIEKAEENIYKELEARFVELDVAVGKIKRQSKYDDTFDTGEPVSDVVNASLEVAAEFSEALLKQFEKRSKPLILGIENFEDQYRELISKAFSEFSQYCLSTLEETSKATKQPHLYGKEYPELHQSLVRLQEQLISGAR
jgi:hypothetical protein